MKINYIGHACFMMHTKAGTRILMDPYDASVGYPVPKAGSVAADCVTASHAHHDHNAVEWLAKPYELIDKAGRYTVKDVAVTAIPCWHDEVQGQKRGPNLIFIYQADGVRLCHLGDLGHELDEETLAAIGQVDALLAPVGGYFTLEPELMARQVRALSPEIVIPMHYATEFTSLPIAGPQRFIAEIGGAVELECSQLVLGGETAPGVYLLQPASKFFDRA